MSDDVKQSRHCLQKENVEKRGKLQSAKKLQAEKERKEPNRIALTTELLLHSAGVGRFHDATRRRAYETRSQFSGCAEQCVFLYARKVAPAPPPH